MTGFIIRRLIQAVIVTLGVTLITFALEHALPGSVAREILGNRATPQAIAQFNQQNHLNASLFTQYWYYLGRLIHGNLGFSYDYNQTVDSLVKADLPRDLVLGGISLALSLLIAIPVGIVQAVKRNRTADYVGTGVSFVLYSMPQYAIALLLIELLAISFRVFPSEGPQSGAVGGLFSDPKALVLPIVSLTLVTYAQFSRYMRSSAVDTLAQDYMRTARAKGLPERLVLWRHLLRNSLISVVTLVGLSIPTVVTGTLIIEQVFNYPGVGLLYYNASIRNDYETMIGITVLVGVVTVVGNLIADIGYALLDPRIRSDGRPLVGPHQPNGDGEPDDGLMPHGTATGIIDVAPEGGEIATTGSPLVLVARTFAQNKLAIAGIAIVVILVLFSFIGPIFHSTDQTTPILQNANCSPNSADVLGCDGNGYDILGRLMEGGQSSIEVGIAVGLIATGFGLIYGAISGFFGGFVDSVLMRIVDVGLAIPIVFLFIFMAQIYKPNLGLLIILLSLVSWLIPARLVRGETLTIRTREYVQAARGMGGRSPRIILRHIVPNTIGTIMVTVTFQVANAILTLAVLQYLGFGLPPSTPTWGGMLSDGTTDLASGYWWQVYPALILIVLAVVAFNFIGDALQDSFDVRLQER